MLNLMKAAAILCSTLLAFSLPSWAEDEKAEQGLTFESFSLENGMEVVVVPNHRVPALTHMLMFKIGSADEARGMSGLAHYLEHMMFKGTKEMEVGEYSARMSKLGGKLNAFTSYDYTGYYVMIAKEHLPMVMQTEADRMVNLDVDEQEFLKEREVIMEERSMRTDNNPSALLSEQIMAALYLHHPYHIPIIGWRHEMEALSREQVFDMYKRYYHPNNALLVVVGDITAAELKPLAEKYYGHLQAGEELTRNWRQEPPAVAERRVILRDEKVQQPALDRVYLAPSYVHGATDKAYALTLLSELLGGSQTSVLYRRLVMERKIASGVSVSYDGVDIGPSTFWISATPVEGVSLEALEKALDEELAAFKAAPIDADDLARAKIQQRASLIYARDGLWTLPYVVGVVWAVGLDADFIQQWADKLDLVTDEQVLDAASYVIKPERSVTGWLLPEGGV